MNAALLLAARLLLQASPSAEAVVIVTSENTYAAPDDATAVVSQATLGQVVGVVDTSGTFARVRTPDGYEGWVPRAAVARYTDAEASRYARAGRVVEVTRLTAYVHREADVATARRDVGDGRFIGATTHGTPAVHEDRLDDPHWAPAFQGARCPR
jgi:hypothetical protein